MMNEALTMEELVCMDGEPVWIRSDGVKGKKWYLVCAVRAEGVQLIDAHGAFHGVENVMKCNQIRRAPFETGERESMRLIDANEQACWACVYESKSGTCCVDGCYDGEKFQRNPNLDREPCKGGPTVIDPGTISLSDTDGVESPLWGRIDKVSRHRELCLRLNELYEKKNHDYGDSFGQTFKAWGPAAAGVRMSDKLNRFVSLSRQAAEVQDESVVDTLMDLANYAVMTVLEMEPPDGGNVESGMWNEELSELSGKAKTKEARA